MAKATLQIARGPSIFHICCQPSFAAIISKPGWQHLRGAASLPCLWGTWGGQGLGVQIKLGRRPAR
eukprot:11109977-Alexandrium_andersonii.AAC.1